jgi:hypothetical protein
MISFCLRMTNRFSTFRPFSWSKKSFLDLLGLKTPHMVVYLCYSLAKKANLTLNLHLSSNGALFVLNSVQT